MAAIETDRNSASVSAPKVDRWPLSVMFLFWPKLKSQLSAFFRFQPKMMLAFGRQPNIHL